MTYYKHPWKKYYALILCQGAGISAGGGGGAGTNAMQFWFNGLPEPGIKRAAAPTTSMKYWANGLPAETIFK